MDCAVSKVMKKEVVLLHDDTEIGEAAEILSSNGVSGAPVLNAAGKVVGMVCERDIVKALTGPAAGPATMFGVLNKVGKGELPMEELQEFLRLPIKEVMTTNFTSSTTKQHVVEAAAVMLDSKVNRLPVVSDGAVKGILTRQDVLQQLVWLMLANNDEELSSDEDPTAVLGEFNLNDDDPQTN